ncbi:membrane protein insertase YidC [Ureibacillus sp. FSL K6-8385]|uniref:Membrane protein insertase YidC n=1 Tax=Ureibacillus terrenus TaxID=118246 RepID=A0A540V2Y9_9BACL|nr:membrane protein insertase YidC [Ureibacillus terrenus]MED3661611.1 membrane protein insertase YidC [Ureibacillus terrenus]MED3763628.1 membrane protein insertase YidC [Ureibacillus terrenus]TQE91109.1 membrane protein insertase YidC [Ureibacillus terrenus]
MKKNSRIILTLAFAAILLSGCREYNQPISADSEGFWNQFIVWPIVSIIEYFSNLFGSYGLGIIAVTIIIRLAILPLTIKQVQSSKKMQELQPKLKELQEKYSSKDAVTQQKYQKELMELMQSSGVNPMMGCLPALIQMPIIIGLYHAISRMNATPEFDLGTFLIFPLAEPSIILAIAAGLIQYIVLMTGPAVDNPQMKIMLYFMPLMVIGFGMVLPAALSLYWVVGNIISVIQNIFIYKKPWEKKDNEKPATTGGSKK